MQPTNVTKKLGRPLGSDTEEHRAFRALARSFAAAGIYRLAEMAGLLPDPDDPSKLLPPTAVLESTRTIAIQQLHNRGFGQPKQEVELSNKDGIPFQAIVGSMTPAQAAAAYAMNMASPGGSAVIDLEANIAEEDKAEQGTD